MRIGQLAKYTGVSVEAIRYYERRGVVPAPARTRSGYRDYPDCAVHRVAFIKQARELEFTLDEIGELIGRSEGRRVPNGGIVAMVESKIASVRRRITELTSLLESLEELRGSCCRSCANPSMPFLMALRRVQECDSPDRSEVVGRLTRRPVAPGVHEGKG
jgi:MerR family mercuric resistance operon transcriptional regulator